MKKNGYKVMTIVFGSLTVAGLIGYSYYIYKIIKKKKQMDKETREINEELDNFEKDFKETFEESLDKVYDKVSVKEKLLKNWDKPPIGKTFEDEMAEEEHPLDDDEESPLIDEDELKTLEEDFEDEKFYKENKNRPPKIVKASSLGDLPASFETMEWIYFAKDDIFTDDEENVISDPFRFIGECADKFEFRDDDSQEEIYILSYEFRCVYHITKYLLSYEEKMEGSNNYLKDLEDYDGEGRKDGYKEGN